MVNTSAALAAVAGTILTGAALDRKYSIRSDIAQIRSARKNRKHLERLTEQFGDSDWSYYHVLHHTFGQNDYDEAFLFEDRSWTFGELRAEIGRLALELENMGIHNRTVVAMMIDNSPEFYLLWWALFKIGAIPAPINTSIRQEPFRHCLRISEAELLFCSYELYAAVAASLNLEREPESARGNFSNPDTPKLKSLAIYDYESYSKVVDVAPNVVLLRHQDLDPVRAEMASWAPHPKIGSADTSQYLFTSGTTGLPKAATWPAGYAHMAASPYRWPYMFEKRRRLYACTPMFHGGATYALLPATVRSGGTVILARKFSVRNFWPDVRRTRANMLFYIGEMVRYLVQAPSDPVHPDETKTHGMEIIYGQVLLVVSSLGIAAPVWRAFRKRFGVPWITEYYSATEATSSINYSHQSDSEPVAKIAHWGPLMRSPWFGQDTFYIIRIDMDTGDIVRDPKTGLCIQAAYGETGEAINRIKPPLQRVHNYVGEGGEEATNKKLIRDVFAKGDLFVRLGDALSMDHSGYMTFQDRLGDTYRAKGHNISTAEVENAFINHPHIASANVFAINMKQYGYDGQMGAAAINFRNGASPQRPDEIEVEAIKGLEQYLTSSAGLAGYAVPRFLRVLVDIDEEIHQREQIGISDSVGNEYVSLILKKLKTSLRKDGFTIPTGCQDRLYWIEKEGHGYVPLTIETQKNLIGGSARL